MSVAEKHLDYGGVYPGARVNYDFFVRPEVFRDKKLTELSPAAKAPMMVVGIMDIPFSIIVDTLLLPFDPFAYFAAQPDEPEESS